MNTYLLVFNCGSYYSTGNSIEEAVTRLGRGDPKHYHRVDNREKEISVKLQKIKVLIEELEGFIVID